MPGSVVLSEGTESWLDRTTNPPLDGSNTSMAWVNLIAAGTGYDILMYVNGIQIGKHAGVLWLSDGPNDPVGSISFDFGCWYHIALVIDSTTAPYAFGYLNGVLEVTPGMNMGYGGTLISLGSAGSGNFGRVRLSCAKFWDRVLTPDEIKAEMYYALPVSRVGLNSCYPMPNRQDLLSAGVPPMRANCDPLADWSGNGLKWTWNGNVTLGPGPRL